MRENNPRLFGIFKNGGFPAEIVSVRKMFPLSIYCAQMFHLLLPSCNNRLYLNQSLKAVSGVVFLPLYSTYPSKLRHLLNLPFTSLLIYCEFDYESE